MMEAVEDGLFCYHGWANYAQKEPSCNLRRDLEMRSICNSASCKLQRVIDDGLFKIAKIADVSRVLDYGTIFAKDEITMNTLIHEKHRESLTMYVNDVIALERDIINAVDSQLEDSDVVAHPSLAVILKQIVAGSELRIAKLQELSAAEGGSMGASVKEAVMGVAGSLAGMYGKLREHPVSRMVRDDRVAMNVLETSYGMLYTLALGIGHAATAEVALGGLNAAPPLVLKLTDLLPGIILRELSQDASLQNGTVEKTVLEAIHNAWRV